MKKKVFIGKDSSKLSDETSISENLANQNKKFQ